MGYFQKGISPVSSLIKIFPDERSPYSIYLERFFKKLFKNITLPIFVNFSFVKKILVRFFKH